MGQLSIVTDSPGRWSNPNFFMMIGLGVRSWFDLHTGWISSFGRFGEASCRWLGGGFHVSDVDGHRVTAFLTNSPCWHGPTLDARHRAGGRCENRIKTLKNTGLGKISFDFHANRRCLPTLPRWP